MWWRLKDLSNAEIIKNSQREIDALPARGTGRKTGNAKKPTGVDDRLTEEERRKRHKEKTDE